MSHNYEYLHSDVRGIYKDLPVAPYAAVPREMAQEAVRYASNFDCYGAGVQTNFCYFMIPDGKGVPNLFFSKTDLKRNTTNQAYYAQCAGWKFNNVYRLSDGSKLPQNNFDELFAFPFFSEAEVDAYAEGERSIPFGSGSAVPVPAEDFPIAPDAIRAILHGIAAHWTLGLEPVSIEVPSDVDYSGYVLAAVRKIYSYLPVAFRINAGFASYIAPQNTSKYRRVSLVFTPASRATAKTIRLDGSSAAAYQHLFSMSFGSKLNAFFKHLSLLSDPRKRKSFLDAVLIDAEFSAADNKIGTVMPDNYSVLGEAIRILDLEGSVKELFPEWYRFSLAYKTFPAGIAGEVKALIDSRMDQEAFTGVLSDPACFPQAQRIGEFLPILKNLQFFTENKPQLNLKLWDYVSAVLSANRFSDADCYSWMKENLSFLHSLGEVDIINTLKDTFAKKCANTILESAVRQIAAGDVSNCTAFRQKAMTIAQTALEQAGQYWPVREQQGKLLKLIEDWIANQLRLVLNQLQNKPRNTAESCKAIIDSVNLQVAVLPEAGKYDNADTLRGEADAFVEQLKKQHADLIVSRAENKLLQLPLQNCLEYRRQYRQILDTAVTDCCYRALPAWYQDQTIACEERIANHVRTAFESAGSREVQTADQHKALYDECLRCAQLLAPEGISESIDMLRGEIAAFAQNVNSKYQELMASTGMLIQSFENKYFLGIDKYAERADTLTDAQKQDVLSHLKALRPDNLANYRAAYQAQTGLPFNATVLLRDRAAGQIVAGDMQEFLRKPIPVDMDNLSVSRILDELNCYMNWARFFNAGSSVTVHIDLSNFDLPSECFTGVFDLDAAMLRDILTLSLDSAPAEMEPAVYAILRRLLSSGAMASSYGCAMLEMLHRCKYADSAEKLLSDLHNLEKTPIRASITRILDEEYEKKYSKKKSNARNILLGVMTGLTLASSTALVLVSLSFSKFKDQYAADISIKEQIIETLKESLSQEVEDTDEPAIIPETEEALLPLPSGDYRFPLGITK